jgi:hypothetical protein
VFLENVGEAPRFASLWAGVACGSPRRCKQRSCRLDEMATKVAKLEQHENILYLCDRSDLYVSSARLDFWELLVEMADTPPK